MGSQEICAFCDDKEQEENNINHTNNFSYKGNTVKFKEEELIQEESPLSFRFIPSGIDYSKIISDFGIIRWSNNSVFKGYFKKIFPTGGVYISITRMGHLKANIIMINRMVLVFSHIKMNRLI